jgi:hypothetical protein
VTELLCRVMPFDTKRRGGGSGTSVGDIPQDPQGDYEFLEMEIQQVVADAQRLRLPIVAGTFAAVQRKQVRFALAAERTDKMPNPAIMLDIRTLGMFVFQSFCTYCILSVLYLILILFRMVGSLYKPGSTSPCAAYLQTLPPPKGRGHSNHDPTHPTCKRMRQGQASHYIDLNLENLRSILKDRWADSAILNAALHLLLEFYPEKESVYLNSAQLDFNWSELAKTPRCYTKVASCLFLDSHWTFGFIDHTTREIWYVGHGCIFFVSVI